MFLYEIGVVKEFRKSDIAKDMIEYLKHICRNRGINEMYVGAMANNEPARKLYKSGGGEEELAAWFVYKM